MEAPVIGAGQAPATILTLEMDGESHLFFEQQRQLHYPASLNRIAAHLTLFHTLPPRDEITGKLVRAASAHRSFSVQVTGLRSLGRGVAFSLQSGELTRLHAELVSQFAGTLTAQDRQRFWPHVVIQNKTTAEASRVLLATMQEAFVPFEVTACGLTLWNYLGGPWDKVGSFRFGESPG